ncbi:MAG: hypothetical protein NT049_08630 [Planctomycetota bacterium]|nr:hypothetical protein [Planctomycetota bacterium]
MLKTLCQLVLLIVAAAPAWAGGVVQTLDARLEGDVAWADGGLSVAGKPVAWDAVVYALPQAVAAGATSGGAMRLDGGEVWRGDIVGLAAKRLTVRSTLLGAREVETDRVRELWFLGAACADGPEAVSSAAAAGTLYRDKGEPIPGTLLWVDETRLAIDSPLGVLTLPREGAVRYSFPAGAAGAKAQVQPAGADLVGLVDGTLLRGAVKPKAGGVEVVHAVLGTLAVPAANIRYVRRSDARVTDLIARLSGAVKEQDILSAGAAGGTRDVRAGDGAAPAGQCLASMRLQPRATAACTLAQGTGKQLRLTGRIEPVPGARGDARLRVTVGGKTVFEKDLAPGAAALPLAVDLPEGGDLGIEVDFGKRIGFPCGVVLEDPLLIVRG